MSATVDVAPTATPIVSQQHCRTHRRQYLNCGCCDGHVRVDRLSGRNTCATSSLSTRSAHAAATPAAQVLSQKAAGQTVQRFVSRSLGRSLSPRCGNETFLRHV